MSHGPPIESPSHLVYTNSQSRRSHPLRTARHALLPPPSPPHVGPPRQLRHSAASAPREVRTLPSQAWSPAFFPRWPPGPPPPTSSAPPSAATRLGNLRIVTRPRPLGARRSPGFRPFEGKSLSPLPFVNILPYLANLLTPPIILASLIPNYLRSKPKLVAPPASGRVWSRPHQNGDPDSTISEENRNMWPRPRRRPHSVLDYLRSERKFVAPPPVNSSSRLCPKEPEGRPRLISHATLQTPPPFRSLSVPLRAQGFRLLRVPSQKPRPFTYSELGAHCRPGLECCCRLALLAPAPGLLSCPPGALTVASSPARSVGLGWRPEGAAGAGAHWAGEAWPEPRRLAGWDCSAASFPAGGSGPGLKRWGAAAVGLGLTLFTCGPHTLHSLITILGTWALIQAQPCSCHALALAWTFSYLLFFRALSLLGLPTPTPFTNAVQLLLTLKLVSLASEVQDLHLAQRKEMATGFSKGPTLGLLPDVPSLMETLSYSYCYVGIMTGEWACRDSSAAPPLCLFCLPPPWVPVLCPHPARGNLHPSVRCCEGEHVSGSKSHASAGPEVLRGGGWLFSA
ncbi:lysophospholipid acyltransferase 7 [Sapajus apella]|uniref:Lysophospholipid acyltransferase 7 n=1 Tax=Sapajus apella TaxID=9515 RepID=A0A6J3H9T6_SAPAP|nr:lysophospholipid acyltransferase 7 [Sapajus apella]